MIPKMAWRNLWRNKRRTIITLVSIGFGMLLAGTFIGMSDYSYGQLIDNAARMGSGHVTVQAAGYNETPSFDKSLQGTDEIAGKAKTLDGVARSFVTINGQAMLSTANDSAGVSFFAIDPEKVDEESLLLIKQIDEGRLFPKSTSKKIVVGKKLGEKLDAQMGDKIVVTLTDKHGDITSTLVRVSGYIRTGVDELDGYFCLLPLDTMRKTLGYGPDEATQVGLVLSDQRATNRVAGVLDKELGDNGAHVATWRDTQPAIAGTLAMDKSGNYLFQLIIVLLIAAGILNTMLMSVMERVREFGILMAVGMPPGRLFRMVVWEAFWLAAMGIVAGVIMLIPVGLWFHIVGLDISQWYGEEFTIGTVIWDPVMRFTVYPDHMGFMLGLVFAITILAGLYPAWKAGRVNPVESIKVI